MQGFNKTDRFPYGSQMLTCCGLKVWWSIENLLVTLFACYAPVALSVLTQVLLWPPHPPPPNLPRWKNK